ncbi:phosphopantetheine-binding protein [Micromonospora sp. NPDC050397]|uniref:phosphopantetheine-binding protein n=1 Tax=Micromonospora sp. NPDC050397 TaxID=3364279 RepID=UPI00384B4DFD
MASATDEGEIRTRTLEVLTKVLGYRPDPELDDLRGLDSLQVLELLVSLEEEFGIDSDRIIEARPDWWVSLNDLVQIISALSVEEDTSSRT